MGKQVRDEIVNKMSSQKIKYLSIIVDSTPDVTR